MSSYKDGATMRKQRKYDIADFVSAYPEGLEWRRAIDEGCEITGNKPETVTRYLTELINYGVMYRDGARILVNDHGFTRWAETAGFRAPPQEVQCLYCGAIYTSRRDTCPKCKSVDRKLYDPEEPTEHPLDTHTYTHSPEIQGIKQLGPSRAALELPLINGGEQSASELDTHIHTQTNDQAGAEAEERAAELLSRFGSARVGRGSYGEPDVLLSTESSRYAVEVKSLPHQTRTNHEGVNGYKANEISLNRDSWEALCEYSDAQGLTPLLLVEVKIQGSKYGHLYHLIPREAVDYKATNSNSRYIRLSVHELPAYSLQSFRPGLPFIGRCVL